MVKPLSTKVIINGAQDAWDRSYKQRQLDREIEELYFNDFEVELPKAKVVPVVRHSSYAYDISQRFFSILLSQQPIVHVRHIAPTRELESLAEEIERWDEAVDKRQRRGFDPWQAMVQDQVIFGRGVVDVEYAPQMWTSYPEVGKLSAPEYLETVNSFTQTAGLPFLYRHVPAKLFVPVESDDQVVAGFWFGTKRVIDIVKDKRNKVPKLRAALADGSVSIMDRVPWVVYKDSHFVTYLVGHDLQWLDEGTTEYGADIDTDVMGDVDVARTFEHGSPGLCPFVMAPGLQTPSLRSDRKFVSVLYFLAHEIKALDNMLSQEATTLYNFVHFAPMVQKLRPIAAPTGADREQFSVKWEMGGAIPLFEGEDVSWLQHPGPHSSVKDDILMTMARLDRLGMSALEMVQGESGVSRKIQMQIASQRFSYLASRMANAYQDIVERRLAIVKNITEQFKGARVYVDNMFGARDAIIGIGSKHLEKPFFVAVDLPDPIGPDLLALADLTEKLRSGENPFFPDRVIMEKFWSLSNYRELQEEILIQQFERSQEYRQLWMKDVLEKAGMKLDQKDLEEATALGMPDMTEIPPSLVNVLQGQGMQPPGTANPPVQPAAGPMIPGPIPGQTQNTPGMI